MWSWSEIGFSSPYASIDETRSRMYCRNLDYMELLHTGLTSPSAAGEQGTYQQGPVSIKDTIGVESYVKASVVRPGHTRFPWWSPASSRDSR